MEQKTKSFFWGAVVGVVLLIAAIIGFFTYLYFKGTAIGTEKLEQQQKAKAEQIEKFGVACSNAVPEALVYFYKTLTPTLTAFQDNPSDKKEVAALMPGIELKRELLSHCATRVEFPSGGSLNSNRAESALMHSNQMMKASSQFATINAYLNGLRIENCDKVCQKDMVRRAMEASAELENILRGKNES